MELYCVLTQIELLFVGRLILNLFQLCDPGCGGVAGCVGTFDKGFDIEIACKFLRDATTV